MIDKIIDTLFPQLKYCRLDAMQKFQMKNVSFQQDGFSLKWGFDPQVIYISYKNYHVGAAYDNKLIRSKNESLSVFESRHVDKIFEMLDTYYS
jgi:hypothetical protein